MRGWLWPLCLMGTNLLCAGTLAWLNARATDALVRTASRSVPAEPGVRARELRPALVALAVHENDIRGAARRHRLDPDLVRAVILAESAGDPLAVSARGAMGLMQVLPGTAREMGLRRPEELFKPRTNLHYGTRYMAELLRRCAGDVPCALACYNAGPTVLTEGRPLPAETRAYVPRVLRFWQALRRSATLDPLRRT